MSIYYNEFDVQKAAWLEELMKEGVIAEGDIDTRSITEVHPDDVRHYTQCHWFAGIGVWSYALRLAGWDDDRPVWTGSCPCQSFSMAGKQRGFDDERHLFPAWRNLIAECRPSVIFGEQAEGAIRKGWLDLVQDELEAEDYAVGKIVLPACSVGADHIRPRIWFTAKRLSHSYHQGPQRRNIKPIKCQREQFTRESGLERNYWSESESVEYKTGCKRRVKPGTFPLAYGSSDSMGSRSYKSLQEIEHTQEARIMRIHGYGDAIVPQLAAEVISTFMEYSELVLQNAEN